MGKLIYLDNASTTFPKPETVYKRMDEINRNLAVNSGRGAYKMAQEATAIIDDTKNRLLRLVNSNGSAKIVFAPSVTIALNQILQGIEYNRSSVVYLSPYEHNAVARTIHFLQKKYGFKVIELPIFEDSLEIDLDKMRYFFAKEPPSLVCVNHVSNVTGYILPASEVFVEAKKYSAITVLDAAQSLGLLHVDFERMNADFIAFAGHKTLYGPFGIAGFFINDNLNLNEVIVGGTGSNSLNLNMPITIPEKFEFGSPNIVAIAGLNASLDTINIDDLFAYEKILTNYLVDQLSQIEKVNLFVPKDSSKHIGIVSFSIDNFFSEDIGIILDEDFGISVRTGYHCAPFIHKYLNVKNTNGTIRIGIGRYNTIEEITILVNAINEVLLE